MDEHLERLKALEVLVRDLRGYVSSWSGVGDHVGEAAEQLRMAVENAEIAKRN